MISMDQVLSRCARIQGDAVPDQTRARWLLELEGRIYCQVTGVDQPQRQPVTQWPEQADQPLLVDGPYQSIYELWVLANVELALGNYEDYDALVGRFNDLFRDFRACWRRNHRPAASRVTV